MKWLFLLRQESLLRDDQTFYDFIPYRYGPFSFEAYRELGILARSGLLYKSELVIAPEQLEKARQLEATLPLQVRRAVQDILSRYEHLRTGVLLDIVYSRYPRYASRSETRLATEPTMNAPLAVYTIGYQAKTIDRFLDELLQNSIKTLVDIRSYAVSHKYGFSGSDLRRLTTGIGVRYLHFPELGIESTMRKGIGTFVGVQELLDYYEREILPKQAQSVTQVSELLVKEASVLMCYEADVQCCHRGRLARRLATLTHLQLIHL